MNCLGVKICVSLSWNGSGKTQFSKVLFLLLFLPGFISPGWQGMGHLAIKTNVLKVLFIFPVLFLMLLDCCGKDTFSQRSLRKHKRIKPPHLRKSPLCKSLLWDFPSVKFHFLEGFEVMLSLQLAFGLVVNFTLLGKWLWRQLNQMAGFSPFFFLFTITFWTLY